MYTQSYCKRFPDLKLSSSFQFGLMFHNSSFSVFQYSHILNAVWLSNYLNLIRMVQSYKRKRCVAVAAAMEVAMGAMRAETKRPISK